MHVESMVAMQVDPLIGRQIKDFVVEERIGRGGMAVVYRASQTSMSRSVALKVIELIGEGNHAEFRQRFAQEAELIAGLEHLHILPVYDYGIIGDEIAFLAMRLLRGGSLAGLLGQGALDLDRAADLFTQVARGLAYAHRRGVIHRDIKPSNILMDTDGNAYVTDFGLAKLIGESKDITRSGTIVGTPAYMSPEQLRGDLCDHRSDIYSLGVVLYHMLTGQPPFDDSSSNIVTLIYQQLEKKPRPPSELNPLITPAVESVVLNALAKSPEERFDDAELMAETLNVAIGRKVSTASYPRVETRQLEGLRAAHRTTASLPQAERPTEPKRSLSRRVLLSGAGLLLALLLVGIVWLAASLARPGFPPAVVLTGEEGAAADNVPTPDEIERAALRLGTNGFIGYITCNQSSEYHATQAREMGDFAADYGLNYRVYDSDSDRSRQIPLIERARAEGAGLLIICPLDITLLDTALTSAQGAGLPLVFLGSGIPSYGGVMLSGDEHAMGYAAGALAGQIIRDEMGGSANVVILDFPDLPSLVVRADGIEAGILEFAPDAAIIGRYVGATPDGGDQSISRLIADGVDIDVIASINDAGSFGAIRALEAANIMPDEVVITSIDAEVLALDHIREGHYMRGSVAVGRELFSRAAIDIAARLLAGATLPETIVVPPGDMVTAQTLAE
jgi:ABC-type sugar transport system substrate-binding protein